MKKTNLLLLLLFFANTLFAQEYTKIDTVLKEFYYSYNFQPDSTNIGKQRSQAMVLQIGKKHSLFTSVNELYVDSLMISAEEMDNRTYESKIFPLLMHAKISSYCSFYLIKNYPQKNQYEMWGDFGEDISLKTKGTLQFNWKLNTAKDTIILNYKCYKATCHFAGRDYVAWYTPDIPISNGPYKFSGLPGLILSVTDTKNQHRFNVYKIKDNVKKEMFTYLEPSSYKTTDAKKYAKAFNLYVTKQSQFYSNPNNGVKFSSEELKAKAIHNILSNNNYIEQYPE